MLPVKKVFFLCWVNYALEGSTFLLMILAACFTLRGHDTYRFKSVGFVSGRQVLPSDEKAFSLTSFEA